MCTACHISSDCLACLAEGSTAADVDMSFQVVVMGFSMGGYVAAALAASHPDLMAGVVIAAAAHDCHTLSW